jgi:hypothetical protein
VRGEENGPLVTVSVAGFVASVVVAAVLVVSRRRGVIRASSSDGRGDRVGDVMHDRVLHVLGHLMSSNTGRSRGDSMRHEVGLVLDLSVRLCDSSRMNDGRCLNLSHEVGFSLDVGDWLCVGDLKEDVSIGMNRPLIDVQS